MALARSSLAIRVTRRPCCSPHSSVRVAGLRGLATSVQVAQDRFREASVHVKHAKTGSPQAPGGCTSRLSYDKYCEPSWHSSELNNKVVFYDLPRRIVLSCNTFFALQQRGTPHSSDIENLDLNTGCSLAKEFLSLPQRILPSAYLKPR